VSPQYVSVAEAAATWNCHPKSIRKLITEGQITGYKVGRVVRVDPAELESVLRINGPTRRWSS
jgi:excisionase family DNA binding protein